MVMWRIRKFFKSINNLIRWFPIIWKDRDWDHHFIFEILKHKLIFMSKSIRKKDNHTLAEYDANRMMLAVRLIEKIQNEFYIDYLINDDEITMEKIIAGYKKHNKAKRILFKLLDQYIERWWD
jgi:hypothetical protein